MRNFRINPIFIIGAGRSGTNILRDTLTTLPEFITWPCDEINLIFRHGNKQNPDDEFGAKHARPEVKRFITQQFESLHHKHPNRTIIEKTCANSLRVPFLLEVFPEARFVHIIRNGYDVTHSAMQRWTSSIELSYLFKKIKFVPVSDIPYYVFSFLENRTKQLFSHQKKMAQWGPVYKGMKEDLKHFPLEEICALQWAACVKKASEDLHLLHSDKLYSVHYEDFVKKPSDHIRSIVEKLQVRTTNENIQKAVSKVRTGSIGKGKMKLGEKMSDRLQSIIEPVMNRYYDATTEAH